MGEPSEVNDTRDAAACNRVDHNCQRLHIYAPKIVNGLNCNPEFIMGNSSDVFGEYKLIEIPITKSHYFPIIGETGELPVNPEIDNAIDVFLLAGGPLASLKDPRIAFLNTLLVGFGVESLRNGNVRPPESASDM